MLRVKIDTFPTVVTGRITVHILVTGGTEDALFILWDSYRTHGDPSFKTYKVSQYWH